MSDENGVKAKLNSVGPRLLKAKLLLLAVLIIFPWFSACARDVQPPKPPIVLPFAVQKAGNKVETEMRIVEEKSYSFELIFMYRKNDQIDRARVRKLTGGADIDQDGKLIEPGMPIPLRLKICAIEPAGERTIFDKKIPEQRLYAWGADSLDKLITNVNLSPGHYRVAVESLMDNSALEGTQINFLIVRTYFGK